MALDPRLSKRRQRQRAWRKGRRAGQQVASSEKSLEHVLVGHGRELDVLASEVRRSHGDRTKN